jgi:hypothetical protein
MNTSNPSLYDQSCPRFILINNILNQKILDGDIVDLNNFNDYLVLPDEPEGFDGAELLLQRDEQYHGFNYEYQVDSLKFACDFGKGYLDSIFEQQGTDANVLFIYGYGTLDNVNVLYVGGLDFNEYSVEDSEYTILNIRKDDFGNILQSNFDIPQEVELDKEVILYSKAIPKRVQYKIPRKDLGLSTVFLNTLTKAYIDPAYNKGAEEPKVPQIAKTDPKGYLFFNDGREGDSDLEIFVTYDYQVDSVNPLESERLKFLMRAKNAGLYTLKITKWVGLYLSSGFTSNYDFVNLRLIRTSTDGTTILEQYTTPFNSSFTPTTILDPNIVLGFDQEYIINMGLDDCLYVFIEIDTQNSSFPNSGFISSVVDFPFNYDIESTSLVVDALTTAPTSTCKFSKTFDILNKIFKKSAILDYNPVKSYFFNESCGNNFYLTSGNNIAGLIKDSNKLKLKDSPSGIINKVATLFNLGWGVEYDEQGRDIVRVEPAEYFYQNSEILSIDSNKITDYNLQVDSSQIYNEIEVGFNKYSKQRETEKGNTIDDFHTKHTYQTPILKNKAKKTIATDLVLSAYEIEILRRKQFEKDGSNKNANLTTDDDIFGIQMTDANLTDTLIVPSASITTEDEFTLFAPEVEGASNFFIGEEVEYTSRAGLSQIRTITSISYFYFVLDFNTGQFVAKPALGLTFAEPLIGEQASSGDVLIKSDQLIGEVSPESTQAFDTIQNLISPLTTYNLRYTPKRMLLQHAKMFMGAFRAKEDDNFIEFKQGDGNTTLTTKFNAGETCVLGDIDKLTLVEGGNLELNEIFNNKYLFLPYKVTFDYPLSFEELNYIRNCMRGTSPDNNNYGYITYTNPKGNVERIFLTEIKYNPAMEEATITGLIKGNYNYIS